MTKTKYAGHRKTRLEPKRDVSPQRDGTLKLHFRCPGKHQMTMHFTCPECTHGERYTCGKDHGDFTGMMLPEHEGSEPDVQWRIVKIVRHAEAQKASSQ